MTQNFWVNYILMKFRLFTKMHGTFDGIMHTQIDNILQPVRFWVACLNMKFGACTKIYDMQLKYGIGLACRFDDDQRGF